MPSSADILSPVSMTAAVNEIRSPNSFIKNMFYSDEELSDTEILELSTIREGRQMAPLVKKDGAAIMIDGDSEEFQMLVHAAHIRLKRPMSPSDLLDKRRAGFGIHTDASELGTQMRAYMARQLSSLMRRISNTEEYLCSLALQNALAYSDEKGVAFTIDFGRDSSQVITLSGADLWTNAASKPADQFLDSNELLNDLSEGVVTDVVLGREAADAFTANANVQSRLEWRPELIKQGQLDLTSNFRDDGALLLGVYNHGARVWRYGRRVTLPDELGGTSVDLVRSKFAEFIYRSPEAQRKVYYSPIRDMKAIGNGKVLKAKRFSKSWDVEDPSARMMLVESNPMPFHRRPNASNVSIQVVA